MFGFLLNQSSFALRRPLLTTVATKSPLLALSPTPQALLLARSKHTLKTNKSVAKRFRATGDGTLKRAKSGRQHNTGYKGRERVNLLGQSTTIKDKKQHAKMKRCMGV